MQNAQPTERLIRVESIEHLQALASAHPIEGFILLNFAVRSYKTVFARPQHFRLENHIDNTKQLLSAEGLYTYSNVGDAIDKGAFYIELQR